MQETRVQSLDGKIPWRKKWQSTPVVLPGNFHEQKSLACYSPWGYKRLWHDLATKEQQLCHMRYVGGFKWLILHGSFFPRLGANSFNCPFLNLKFYLVLLGPELLPPWDSHSSELSLLMGSSIHLLWTGLQLLYLDFLTNRPTLRTIHTRYMHLADFTKGSVDGIFFFFFFCCSNTNYTNWNLRLPCFCSGIFQLILVPLFLTLAFYCLAQCLITAPQHSQTHSLHNSVTWTELQAET